METRNIFENISCIDHRYSLSEAEAFNGLSKYISEQASIKSCAKCEAALVKAHLKIRNQLTDEIASELDAAHLYVFVNPDQPILAQRPQPTQTATTSPY